MAAGLPAKTTWATSDVFTAAGANDVAGTVNLLGLSTVTATAAGTTTLTVASNRKQTFTGSTTQTVTMPVVSTLSLGDTFEINNASSGVVTVQSSGANSILAMAASSRAVFTCVLITGTTAASWAVAAVAAAGGKVLQVVSTTYSTQTLSTSTSWADTGITLNITPSLNTSKVLCLVSVANVRKESSGGNTAGFVNLQLLRGSTQIGFTESGYTGDTATESAGSVPFLILDSPASTSAQTYKVQFSSAVSGQQVRVQGTNTTASISSIVLLEIGA